MSIKQLKLEVALFLTIVMACSAPASGLLALTASAAAKTQVRLNVKSKTLKAGQKGYKLRLVNNKQKWKIQKATTSKASVCKPYGRKSTYVLLKGKKKGTATIRVKVVRTVTKNGKKTTKSKWLSCKVRVKQTAADMEVPDTAEVVNGDVTVSSQAQLEDALKNAETKTLRLQTDAAETFTIPKADYKDIALTVDAPNADVVNNGTFQSISVLAIKDSTWLENAVGNFFHVLAKAARIVVQPGADVSSINFKQAGAKVSLEVNGNVNGVSFAAPDADVTMSVAQGSTVSNVTVVEDAQRTKMDMDVDGSIGNMQFIAPDADVKMAVAKSGTVNGFSMAAQAKSTKVDLTIDGQVGNVAFAAPQADIKVAVAKGGAVSKVAMDAAADSAKVGLDVKGTVSDVSLDAQKADVSLTVDDNGKVGSVAVSKEMNLALSGTAKAAIAVKVSAAAKITASTSIALESSADISLLLEKGAEGSSVKITGNLTAIKVNIENKSEQNVAVITPNGNYTVSEGSSRDISVNAPAASGGSSSGSSSSGSSSSGGSSSGGSGSTEEQPSGPPKGIKLDHTDFTMTVGQEETICVSADPEGSGRLAYCDWNCEDGTVFDDIVSYSYPDSSYSGNTINLKAEKAGVAVISATADVYGTGKDSAVLYYPNQTISIIVTVTDDSTPEPAVTCKLTPGNSPIDVGDFVADNSKYEYVKAEFSEDVNITYSHWEVHGRAIESWPDNVSEDRGYRIKGHLKGKGTVAYFATIQLADGTTTDIASIVEIEVTDENAPDPESFEPYFWSIGRLYGPVYPINVDEKGSFIVQNDPRAYGLMLQKVEYSLSDNETVFKIDKKDSSRIDVTGLKAGSSTLTADITYRVGTKTFTKTISKEIKVKNPPEISITASVISGSAVGTLAVQIDKVNVSSTDSTDEFRFFEDFWDLRNHAIKLSPDGKECTDGSKPRLDLTRPDKEYQNEEMLVYIEMANGDTLNAMLLLTVTKNEDGTYKADLAYDKSRTSWARPVIRKNEYGGYESDV